MACTDKIGAPALSNRVAQLCLELVWRDPDSAYFLGDALGSVRQLVDEEGTVTLAKTYEPYGEVLISMGTGVSAYGYTGEMHSSFTNLLYLRARFYSPVIGRFQTRDTWQGDYTRHSSLNRWNYGYSNPIRYNDPSGHIPVDIILDLLFLGYDVGAILIEGPTTVNMAALAADAACALIPYGTGGGLGVRLGSAAALQGAAHVPAYIRAVQATTKAAQSSINSQESSVGNSLSGQDGIENLVSGYDQVRQYLGMGNNQKAADFLYYNSDEQRWAIDESKGGHLDHATNQLSSTYDALIKQNPGASGNVDFFIATNKNQYQRLLNGQRVEGYLMKDGYLGWTDEAGNWIYHTIDGNRVRVYQAP